MFRRVGLLVLIIGSEYVIAAGVLLFALRSGMEAPQVVAALGAILAGVTALVGYLFGRRHGRAEAAKEPPPPAASPELGAEVAFLRHFFLDIVEALPVGFATLDNRMIVRSANRALRTLLALPEAAPMAGVPLRATRLGSAIYDGPRTSLAGRPFHEIAQEVGPAGGALDLSPLLVPKDGEPWAARLRARLEPWPAPPSPAEHFFLWAEVMKSESPSMPKERETVESDLRRAHERLLEETLLRDALLAALPLGVMLLDEGGSLLGWSDSVRDILATEITLQEGLALGEAWPVFGSPPHREALQVLKTHGIPFVARLPQPAPATAGATPPPASERIIRGAPVGAFEAAPRRFLLLVEERWDPAGIASMGIEVAAARSRAELLALRIPEIRSRLGVLASVARFLRSSLPDADLKVLSEIEMIEIQRDRIDGALREISAPSAPPADSPESA